MRWNLNFLLLVTMSALRISMSKCSLKYWQKLHLKGLKAFKTYGLSLQRINDFDEIFLHFCSSSVFFWPVKCSLQSEAFRPYTVKKTLKLRPKMDICLHIYYDIYGKQYLSHYIRVEKQFKHFKHAFHWGEWSLVFVSVSCEPPYTFEFYTESCILKNTGGGWT